VACNNGKHGLDSEWMRGELINILMVVYLRYFYKQGNNGVIWKVNELKLLIIYKFTKDI